jgi:hypothetical protein
MNAEPAVTDDVADCGFVADVPAIMNPWLDHVRIATGRPSSVRDYVLGCAIADDLICVTVTMLSTPRRLCVRFSLAGYLLANAGLVVH